jgi:hypothetical protein
LILPAFLSLKISRKYLKMLTEIFVLQFPCFFPINGSKNGLSFEKISLINLNRKASFLEKYLIFVTTFYVLRQW